MDQISFLKHRIDSHSPDDEPKLIQDLTSLHTSFHDALTNLFVNSMHSFLVWVQEEAQRIIADLNAAAAQEQSDIASIAEEKEELEQKVKEARQTMTKKEKTKDEKVEMSDIDVINAPVTKITPLPEKERPPIEQQSHKSSSEPKFRRHVCSHSIHFIIIVIHLYTHSHFTQVPRLC